MELLNQHYSLVKMRTERLATDGEVDIQKLKDTLETQEKIDE